MDKIQRIATHNVQYRYAECINNILKCQLPWLPSDRLAVVHLFSAAVSGDLASSSLSFSLHSQYSGSIMSMSVETSKTV